MKHALNILDTLKPYKYLYKVMGRESQRLEFASHFKWCVQPPVELLLQWTMVQLGDHHLGFLTESADPECKYLWSDIPPEDMPRIQGILIKWS